jgi:predicted P-loop ATPase
MEDSGAFEETRLAAARGELSRALHDGMAAPRAGGDWTKDLHESINGSRLANPHNVNLVFTEHPQMAGVLGFDERGNQAMVLREAPWEDTPSAHPRAMNDTDITAAAVWLNSTIRSARGGSLIRDVLTKKSLANCYDPVKGVLESLPAPTSPRQLDIWLENYFGVRPCKLYRAYARKVLISLVARAFLPGCQVDTTLVLTGGQGTRKSSSLRVIAGERFFSEAHLEFNDHKRLCGALHNGQWIHEIAEIDQYSKVDLARVRELITTRADEYTPMFGRMPVKLPRRSIFIATCNDKHFLRDPFGSRRYWSVQVGDIDVASLAGVRDQLLAEAREAFLAGEQWHLTAGEEQLREDDAASFETELVGLSTVRSFVQRTADHEVVIDDLLALLPRTGLRGTPQQHVGCIMAAIGWKSHRRKVGRAKITYYVSPDKTPEDLLLIEDRRDTPGTDPRLTLKSEGIQDGYPY